MSTEVLLQTGVLLCAIAGVWVKLHQIHKNDLRHIEEKVDALSERVARIEGRLDSPQPEAYPQN